MIEEHLERYANLDTVEALSTAWMTTDLTLAERARLVSRLQMRSRLTVSGAARVCNTSPAEMQALLELATLEDDDLLAVSKVNPPATTWILFAGADSDTIRAGVKSLVSAPPGEPVLASVYEAMRSELGPDLDERIAAISGATLKHLAKKATEYGKLTPWQQKFLGSVATQRRTGKRLTEKQIVQLRKALVELVELGVVKHDSPDKDQGECDEVLRALRM